MNPVARTIVIPWKEILRSGNPIEPTTASSQVQYAIDWTTGSGLTPNTDRQNSGLSELTAFRWVSATLS